MKRILLLCEYPALNGAERSLLSAVPLLQAAGYDLFAAAPPVGPLTEALASAKVTVLPFESSAGMSLSRRREALAHQICDARPSLVHANSLAMTRLAGPVTAALNIPSIGHLRDIVRLTRAAVRDVNIHQRLLAVSQATRDWHVQQGLDAQRVHVLYNGVDVRRFQPRPASGWLHHEIGLPSSAVLIGCIGQIGMRKGQDVLLAAMGPVLRDCPRAHIVLCGVRHSSKAEAIAFERALSLSGNAPPLAGRLHRVGQREDIHLLLNELTLLVHPARQEPLGRVLLEALAAGVPVIATDVGGTREILGVDPAHCAGRLVPSGDIEALRAAIGELLQDSAFRQSLAMRGRQRAEAQFTADRSGRTLAKHYQAVLLAKRA